MNWFGNQQGEGYEYHLLFITVSLVLLISGGGKSLSTGGLQKQVDHPISFTNMNTQTFCCTW